MISVAALSDKGPVRETNQDACCVEVAQTSTGDVFMAVVCDGVGGLEEGEYASAAVTENFARWFETSLPRLMAEARAQGSVLGAARIRESWGELLSSLNEALHRRAGETRMATTLSGVLVMDGRFVVVHVGDTRVYRVSRTAGITQVTEDQTLVNQQVADGNLTLAEAAASRKGHIILQAVGASESVSPAFYSGKCRDEELFVVCSDGAWHHAGEEHFQDMFEEADWFDDDSLQDACARIIAYDLECGETDNLTIACFATRAQLRPRESAVTQPHDRAATSGNALIDMTYVDITQVDVASEEGGES